MICAGLKETQERELDLWSKLLLPLGERLIACIYGIHPETTMTEAECRQLLEVSHELMLVDEKGQPYEMISKLPSGCGIQDITSLIGPFQIPNQQNWRRHHQSLISRQEIFK